MHALINGMDITFSDEGRGQPLIFIHGLGGRSSNWINQRRFFQNQYRVICPDLPGHGASSGHESAFGTFAETVLGLLDALQLTRCAIVGLSTGARVALTIAATRPDKVACLTAINTFVNLSPPDRSARFAIYDLLLANDNGAQWAEALLHQMNIPDDSVIGRGFRRAAASNDPRFIRRIFYEMANWDQNDELRGVECPVQLIRGSFDHFVPAYCSDDLSSRLKVVRVDTLDGLGHLPYLEDPARFNEALSAFLREHIALQTS